MVRLYLGFENVYICYFLKCQIHPFISKVTDILSTDFFQVSALEGDNCVCTSDLCNTAEDEDDFTAETCEQKPTNGTDEEGELYTYYIALDMQ